jgi:HTH-type transcriptional regulator / antitoxin HigA
MKTLTKSSGTAKDRYLELVQEFPLKAIHTQAQYERAMEVASRLAIRGERSLAAGERDYLEALMVLIEGYDLAQLPWKKASGVELVRHLMEEHQLNVSDLGKIVGSRTLASLILSGKREISKQAMHRLGEYFKVPPSVFM